MNNVLTETSAGEAAPWRRRTIGFALFVLGLSACFYRPLFTLGRFAWHSEFFSYLPLIPVISGYLVWLKRPALPRPSAPLWKWSCVPALLGAALLIGWACAEQWGWDPDLEDYLTLTTASYLLFVVAGCLAFFGSAFSRAVAFPLAFLVFMIPMPAAMLDTITSFFQTSSAVTAAAMLKIAGMKLVRDGLVLNLPDYSIWVAPECSGIHSTMVLLITAVLAGNMFLRSRWKRAALILFVLPLAILRNGFRIFVISELCVRISHDMINSPIHRKGGPIFFALSLIPFFALLLWLRKSEINRQQATDSTVKAPISPL